MAGVSWGRGRRPATKLLLVAVAVALGAACGPSEPVSTSEATFKADVAQSTCNTLDDEVADLVVELADHAATSSTGGLPAGVLEVDHPNDVDIWKVAASLAEGSRELEARVDTVAGAVQEAGCPAGWAHEAVDRRAAERLAEGRKRIRSGLTREEHMALNLVAILAANFAPLPAADDVPEGFPPEFPVHPGAELVAHERNGDGSVMAAWTVKGRPVREVADYYQTRLQEARFGGWSVGSSSGGGGSDGSSRHGFEIAGYGFTGSVSVETSGTSADVVVTATLVRG